MNGWERSTARASPKVMPPVAVGLPMGSMAARDTLVGINYFAGWWEELPNKWHGHGWTAQEPDWRPQHPERVPLLGNVPLEPAVGAGGDAGIPVASVAGDGAAAAEFHRIARRIIDDIAPPVNMAGCSARMLSLVSAAFDERDARAAEAAQANTNDPQPNLARGFDRLIRPFVDSLQAGAIVNKHGPADGCGDRASEQETQAHCGRVPLTFGTAISLTHRS